MATSGQFNDPFAQDHAAPVEEHEKVEHEEDHGDDHSSKAENSDDARPSGSNKEKFDGDQECYEITEEDCYDELGYSYPNWKKW